MSVCLVQYMYSISDAQYTKALKLKLQKLKSSRSSNVVIQKGHILSVCLCACVLACLHVLVFPYGVPVWALLAILQISLVETLVSHACISFSIINDCADSLLRMVEVLQREVDKLREERLRLLRETVVSPFVYATPSLDVVLIMNELVCVNCNKGLETWEHQLEEERSWPWYGTSISPWRDKSAEIPSHESGWRWAWLELHFIRWTWNNIQSTCNAFSTFKIKRLAAT